MNMPNINRIEGKIDSINTEVRDLIKAIYNQSGSIVKLTEQMKNSGEAIDRAHQRIDTVNERVEGLRDLPTKTDYIEKRLKDIEKRQSQSDDQTLGNALKLAESFGMRRMVDKYGMYIVIGLIVVGLGLIGKIFGG